MEHATRLVRRRRFGRAEVVGLVVVGTTMIQFGYQGEGKKGWLTESPCHSVEEAIAAFATMAEDWRREGYEPTDWVDEPAISEYVARGL